jgi:hypothetical protein
MDKESEGFAYLRQIFPKINEAKKKEGIFLGPQIKQLFEDGDFSTKLNAAESIAWDSFENVCRTFLGNERAENYSDIVQELISSYSAMGCNMSLTLDFLHFHLDYFPVNMEAFSDEHGENSIRTFPKWKRGTMENGFQICWLTTAGVL